MAPGLGLGQEQALDSALDRSMEGTQALGLGPGLGLGLGLAAE